MTLRAAAVVPPMMLLPLGGRGWLARCLDGNTACCVGRGRIACGICAEKAALDRIAGAEQTKCITAIKTCAGKTIDDQAFESVVGGVHDKGGPGGARSVDLDKQHGVVAHSQRIRARAGLCVAVNRDLPVDHWQRGRGRDRADRSASGSNVEVDSVRTREGVRLLNRRPQGADAVAGNRLADAVTRSGVPRVPYRIDDKGRGRSRRFRIKLG